jgi:hypothetical protein
MRAALQSAFNAIEAATDIMHADDTMPVTALEPSEIERIHPLLCGVLVEVDQAIEAAPPTQQKSSR